MTILKSNDRAAWFALSVIIDKAIPPVTVEQEPTASEPSARPIIVASATRRNLTKELMPVAVANARRNVKDIGDRVVMRFLADFGDISFGSIDAHLRDSFVLRRIKEHYAGTRPEMLLKNIVRTDVLKRFLDEAKEAA